MPRRFPRHLSVLRQDRHGEFANGLGTLAACLACTLGSIMLILAFSRGDRCKMRAIDSTAWNRSDIDGNLIKWFKYTGTLLLISGMWANCTIGACPATLRTCCPGVGGAIADILAGVCGKMVLLTIYRIGITIGATTIKRNSVKMN